jgi:glycerol kinase
VYLVPAFTGLGSPWWDPYARGTLVGITRGTGRAQLARAVVEAMAYQTRDVVDAMAAASGPAGGASLRVDGGASVMDLLLQLQADQLGVPCGARPWARPRPSARPTWPASPSGVWGSLDEIATHWELDVEVTPTGDRAAADAHHARWPSFGERPLEVADRLVDALLVLDEREPHVPLAAGPNPTPGDSATPPP